VIHLLSAGGKKFPPVLLARWRSVLFLARFLVRFVAFDRELGRRRQVVADVNLEATFSYRPAFRRLVQRKHSAVSIPSALSGS
jgi:hypothetical protein